MSKKFNPYKPSILFVGHRQTLQTRIRHHKMQTVQTLMKCHILHFIRVFTPLQGFPVYKGLSGLFLEHGGTFKYVI